MVDKQRILSGILLSFSFSLWQCSGSPNTVVVPIARTCTETSTSTSNELDASTSPLPPTPRVEATDATTPDTTESEPEVLATVSGDLEGDGVVETVRLYSNGVLRVFRGDSEVPGPAGNPAGTIHNFAVLSINQYQPGESPLRLVDIDRRDRQREIVIMEMRGDEDPSASFRFYTYHEGHFFPMLHPQDYGEELVYAPHGIRPEITGNGQVIFRYSTCVRDADSERRIRGISQDTVRRLVISDGFHPHGDLMENIQNTRRLSDCVMAACPAVLSGPSEIREGEILRNLATPNLEQWQALTLTTSSVSQDGTIVVTLQEEKHETTYLDAIYLEADGHVFYPTECNQGTAAYCNADQSYHLLHPQERVQFHFHVGAAQHLRLWARGYYVPHVPENTN